MDTPATPVIRRQLRLPLVWILPAVALLVGAYVIQRELADRGPVIEISFADAAGVSVDHTKLVHKGIEVGVVSDVRLNPSLDGAVIEVSLRSSAATLARDGSKFWIRRPEISLRRVTGLDTLISGVSLSVEPGDGTPATAFKGLDAPPFTNEREGTAFLLNAPHRHGLDTGTPVTFRGIQVGQVIDCTLAPDATGVLVRIEVDPPHHRLVRENTVFWNASGVDMSVGLFSGVRIREGGTGSLFSGAISFATPDASAPAALPGTSFKLADRVDEHWLKWAPAFPQESAGETRIPHN